MIKRLKEYEIQLKTIPTEIKEEVGNNNLKWEQILKEQKEIYEEQYKQLQEDIAKKNKKEEELNKRNNELLIQIEILSNQINEIKADQDYEYAFKNIIN